MKTSKYLTLCLFLLMLLPGYAQQREDDFPEEARGWQIAVQASTYRRFTFVETLDKVVACGLRYVEAFPGQQIGGIVEGAMGFQMDEQTRQYVKQALHAKGVKLVSYGVVSPKNEADWRRLFAFAKDMDIQTIVSEPKPEFLPLLGELTAEYGIRVAIHNHATPTPYWKPETVLETVAPYGDKIGACADIGHWMRSGLSPVECLRVLRGRVVSIHMKDLNTIGDLAAHDVPWGKGKAGLKKVFKELRRQSFHGVIAVEYEYRRDDEDFDSVPEIRESVSYLRKQLSRCKR